MKTVVQEIYELLNQGGVGTVMLSEEYFLKKEQEQLNKQ